MFTRRHALGTFAATVIARPASAQVRSTLRIGVINDQSGPYRSGGGLGSVACVRQAIDEFAGPLGLQVELRTADHQGKADVALGICRQWFDDGVDVAMDFQNSAVALACAGLARERDKVALVCNAGTSDLTGRACSPNTVHWAWDTQMLARVSGNAQVRKGHRSWFFIAADYAFGRALEADTSAVVLAGGGTVAGVVRTPFPTSDFSSALLQAQASPATVVALALAGGDAVNAVKQAAEFGLQAGGKTLVALLLHLNDVHALGLETAQGLSLAEVFYWDLNERTRAFASRVQPRMEGQAMPNMGQAACYAAAIHYMKTAAAMGVAEARRSGVEVVSQMKARETNDDAFDRCRIREDGRVMHTGYLMRVKTPAQSGRPYDYYVVEETVPPAQVWRPLGDRACPLVPAG